MKRQIVLIVALTVGLAAAILTRLYVGAKEAEVDRQIQMLNDKFGTLWALAYKRDIPVGTPLQREDLFLIQVPARGLRGQALTEDNVQDAVGRKVLLGHRAKEVVFWSDLEGGDTRIHGLSDSIKRQMRAVSINCSGAASVSGMIRPNDHVDVIGTFTFPGTDGKVRAGDVETRTILQNVLVLATGSHTAKDRTDAGATARAYSTVTIEVTPREAEIIAFTEQLKGRLMLTLRNRSDTSSEQLLPKVDFDRIKSEIERLNENRQQKKLYGGH